MVSLTDSEWLTFFFTFVALLIFFVMILLLIYAILYSITEEVENGVGTVAPVRTMKTNLAVNGQGELVREKAIIVPANVTQKQEQCVVDIAVLSQPSTDISSSIVYSSEPESSHQNSNYDESLMESGPDTNSCRALVAVKQSSESHIETRPTPKPRRAFSVHFDQVQPTGFVDIPLDNNKAPRGRAAPFKWCPVRKVFIQEELDSITPPRLNYNGMKKTRITNPFIERY